MRRDHIALSFLVLLLAPVVFIVATLDFCSKPSLERRGSGERRLGQAQYRETLRSR